MVATITIRHKRVPDAAMGRAPDVLAKGYIETLEIESLMLHLMYGDAARYAIGGLGELAVRKSISRHMRRRIRAFQRDLGREGAKLAIDGAIAGVTATLERIARHALYQVGVDPSMPNKSGPAAFARAPREEILLPDQWGKDHTSTLLYLESRETDHRGAIDPRQMRTNPRTHLEIAVWQQGFSVGPGLNGWSNDYGTKLPDGTILDWHDDWSCAEDMVAANYLNFDEHYLPVMEPVMYGITVHLTPKGRRAAALIRANRAAGIRDADFDWKAFERS